MCFLLKIIFHFPPKEKISYFLEKRNTILPDVTKKVVFRRQFFGKTTFSEHLKKTSHFQVFFLERSSFLLCLKNKNILLGKRNTDNTRKIIFQCDFSGKTIFSKHLEKEDMVFRALSLLCFVASNFEQVSKMHFACLYLHGYREIAYSHHYSTYRVHTLT